MTLGVLGGGQLGRMIGLAAAQLGQRSIFLDPGAQACAGHVGSLIVGAYDDVERLAEISRRAEVVTYEFENVPLSSARFLADRVPVFPPPRALEVSQDRLREKEFFRELSVETAPFAPASSLDELRGAVATVGLPAVVKTRCFGYDGKGQHVVRSDADVDAAWHALGAAPLIVEGFVPFDCEVSTIAVRGRDGAVRSYPLVENRHAGGILRVSVPGSSRIDGALEAAASEAAARVLDALDYVGVLTIEWFVAGGRLIANELAPRVHNSGHYSVEGAETSQFENHVRAVLGLPLGATRTVGYPAMVNLIGAVPDPASLLALDGVHVHLYGKAPAPGRKVGHVTIRAASAEERDSLLARVRERVVDVEPQGGAPNREANAR